MAVVPRGPLGKVACTHCGRVHDMELNPQVRKGMIIKPFSGGYEYGRCRFCKRGGLEVIESPYDDTEKKEEKWEFLTEY